MARIQRFFAFCGMAVMAASLLHAQAPAGTAQQIKREFADVNRKMLAMAKDFPADKYGFRLRPEMRSFGEVIVHATSGIVYAGKIGRGQKANWDELNAKEYPDKAAIVGLMERSVNEAESALKSLPESAFTKSVEPWVGVLEHTAEHYGLLVAYYRANGLVPPESRPSGGK